VATLCQAGLSAPFFQQHLLTSHLCVTFWYILQYFKPSCCYYICCSDVWSVIFDVAIVMVLRWHRLHPYKVENLTDTCWVCSDCPTAQPFLHLSPSPQASLLPETNSIKTRAVNKPTMACKHSSERKSPSMWQTSVLSCIKKLPQPPQLLRTITPMSQQPSTSRQDSPPTKRLWLAESSGDF